MKAKKVGRQKTWIESSTSPRLELVPSTSYCSRRSTGGFRSKKSESGKIALSFWDDDNKDGGDDTSPSLQAFRQRRRRDHLREDR